MLTICYWATGQWCVDDCLDRFCYENEIDTDYKTIQVPSAMEDDYIQKLVEEALG